MVTVTSISPSATSSAQRQVHLDIDDDVVDDDDSTDDDDVVDDDDSTDDDDAADDDDAVDDDDSAGLPPEVLASFQAAANSLLFVTSFSDLMFDVDTDPGARGAGCPTRTFADATVTVDYGTGCEPDSGWTTAELSGSVMIAIDRLANTVTLTFVGFGVNGALISGTVTGTFARAAGTLTVVLTCDLVATVDDGGIEFDGGLTLVFAQGAGATVTGSFTHTSPDGTVSDVSAAGLELVYVEGAACPLPSAGTLAVSTGAVTVTYLFDANSPVTGEVELTIGPFTETVNVCEGILDDQG